MKKTFSPIYIFLIVFCITIVMFVMISVFMRQSYDETPTHKNDWTPLYTWAYSLGITTIPDINKANMDGPIYRKSAAKMMSVFAIKVFNIIPDEHANCSFNDIGNEIAEVQKYILLSCQLGIMGRDYYGNPVSTFNPDYVLTRDQLVTILSRILFGHTYNIHPWELWFGIRVKNFFLHSLMNIQIATGIPINIFPTFDRYTKHMNAIKKLNIMTTYTPTTKEFRGYVMGIMKKLDELWLDTINHLVK